MSLDQPPLGTENCQTAPASRGCSSICSLRMRDKKIPFLFIVRSRQGVSSSWGPLRPCRTCPVPSLPSPPPSLRPPRPLLPPHRPPCCSSNVPDTVLPQGFCTCRPLSLLVLPHPSGLRTMTLARGARLCAAGNTRPLWCEVWSMACSRHSINALSELFCPSAPYPFF